METAQILLKEGARLRLSEGACLPLRSDFGRCRACATVCPSKVIQVVVEQVSLADGCLNCGRCVAACPTDALRLEGYSTPFELAAGTAPVEVECANVPLRERAPGAVEVPCLGALSVGRVAELHEMAGPRGVALVDRGWCGHCSAGCGEHGHPSAQVREQLVLRLGAISDPRPAPKCVYRPLSLERLPRDIPVPAAPPDEGPAVTRRQFFRTVAQDPIGGRRKGSPMGESDVPPSRSATGAKRRTGVGCSRPLTRPPSGPAPWCQRSSFRASPRATRVSTTASARPPARRAR